MLPTAYSYIFEISPIFGFAENEVGGEAFLLLTKEQIEKLVPAVGPQAKLLKKHSELLNVSLVLIIYIVKRLVTIYVLSLHYSS